MFWFFIPSLFNSLPALPKPPPSRLLSPFLWNPGQWRTCSHSFKASVIYLCGLSFIGKVLRIDIYTMDQEAADQLPQLDLCLTWIPGAFSRTYPSLSRHFPGIKEIKACCYLLFASPTPPPNLLWVLYFLWLRASAFLTVLLVRSWNPSAICFTKFREPHGSLQSCILIF